MVYIQMDPSAKKAFQVKVRCLVRTLKEYKAYRNQVQAYDLNLVSQDKKQQQFYLESKSALEQVQKKLVEYYHALNAHLNENEEAIKDEESVKDDFNTAEAHIKEVKELFPGAC